MQLIGMLDSPYVRRVAISLQLLGLRFAHQSISVFSTFAQFQQINPVAPQSIRIIMRMLSPLYNC
jgi:glutathione S-transferase